MELNNTKKHADSLIESSNTFAGNVTLSEPFTIHVTQNVTSFARIFYYSEDKIQLLVTGKEFKAVSNVSMEQCLFPCY